MKRAGLSGLALGMMVFTAAAAQETGTRFKRFTPANMAKQSGMSEAEHQRFTLTKFSDCVVQRDRNEALIYLGLAPTTKGAMKIGGKIFSPECIKTESGGQLRIPGPVVRSGLYGALYRADFGRHEGTLSEQPLDLAKDENRDLPNYVALREFAECVVRSDPANSRAAVLAYVGSTAEKTAFAALAPKFGPCLPQGTQVEFSKTIIQGLLGEVLYRLSTPASS